MLVDSNVEWYLHNKRAIYSIPSDTKQKKSRVKIILLKIESRFFLKKNQKWQYIAITLAARKSCKLTIPL